MEWVGLQHSHSSDWRRWGGGDRNAVALRADFSLSCFWGCLVCAFLMSCIQHTPSPSTCSRGPPTNQGACVLRSPGPGNPISGSDHARSPGSLCTFSLPLRTLPRTQVWTWSLFFPSYSIRYAFFLQPWLQASASCQLVFIENCSTYSFIFDIFGGGGKLLIFSPHILTLPPLYSLHKCLKNVFSCLSYKNVKKSKCP